MSCDLEECNSREAVEDGVVSKRKLCFGEVGGQLGQPAHLSQRQGGTSWGLVACWERGQRVGCWCSIPRGLAALAQALCLCFPRHTSYLSAANGSAKSLCNAMPRDLDD